MAVTNNGRVIIFGATADAKTGVEYIEKVRWVGATTQGHTLSMATTGGDVFLAAEANADLRDEDIELHGLSVDGIVVTMGSGVVYVYLQ